MLRPSGTCCCSLILQCLYAWQRTKSFVNKREKLRARVRRLLILQEPSGTFLANVRDNGAPSSNKGCSRHKVLFPQTAGELCEYNCVKCIVFVLYSVKRYLITSCYFIPLTSN